MSTWLSDGTLNWQNARKRNIAWEPGTVAALEISNLFDGGVVIARKFPGLGEGEGTGQSTTYIVLLVNENWVMEMKCASIIFRSSISSIAGC